VWGIEKIVALLEGQGSKRMRPRPRRIVLHVMIILVVLALPFLLGWLGFEGPPLIAPGLSN
jgi:hypothetical protein